jgi:hypothetical protein
MWTSSAFLATFLDSWSKETSTQWSEVTAALVNVR